MNTNITSRFKQMPVRFGTENRKKYLILFETDLQTGLPIRSFFVELPDRYVSVRNFRMYLN